MKQEVIIRREEKTVVRFSGVTKAAKTLGISQSTLTLILHGKRTPGAKLAEKMQRMGIQYPPAVATAE